MPKVPARKSDTQGRRPMSTVSHTTLAAPRATASHWARRSRSPTTRTPSRTLTSGVMKYPRLPSNTMSLLTAQIQASQLEPIRTPARTSRPRTDGIPAASRTSVHDRRTRCTIRRTVNVQKARWARTSSAGTSATPRQKAGETPHITWAQRR